MGGRYRPITIPAGAEVAVEGNRLVVKGKLGVLQSIIPSGVNVSVEGQTVDVTAPAESDRAKVGTVRAYLRNMLHGVLVGYQKVLELRGMGYRVQKTKEGLQVTCGFSHPVVIPVPEGIVFDVVQVPNPDDTKEQMWELVVKGFDKQLVGSTAAAIRRIKPPDVYHGKGFRYRGERVRKKAGKRAVAAQT